MSDVASSDASTADLADKWTILLSDAEHLMPRFCVAVRLQIKATVRLASADITPALE